MVSMNNQRTAALRFLLPVLFLLLPLHSSTAQKWELRFGQNLVPQPHTAGTGAHGVDEVTANGNGGCVTLGNRFQSAGLIGMPYLSKFDLSGNQVATRQFSTASHADPYRTSGGVAQLNNGSQNIAWISTPFTGSSFQVHVGVVNSTLTPQWDRVYGNSNYTDQPQDISVAANSNLLVTARSYGGPGGSAIYLSRLNAANGVPVFQYMYFPSGDGFYNPTVVRESPITGNIIVAGFVASSDADAFIMSVSSSGMFQWLNVYGGENLVRLEDLIVDSDGNLVGAGWYGGMDSQPDQVYVLKTNSGGTLIDAYRYYPSGYLQSSLSFATAITENLDGDGYVITGSSTQIAGSISSRVFALELASNLTVVNSQIYSGPYGSRGNDIVRSVIGAGSDPGYFICGEYMHLSSGTPYDNNYLARVNANLESGCETYYPFTRIEHEYEDERSATRATVTFHETVSYTTSTKSLRTYLCQIIQPKSGMFGDDEAPSAVEETPAVYPNPVAAGSAFSIRFTLAEAANIRVRITDMLGREVYRSFHAAAGGANELLVDTPNISPGTYTLVLDTGAGSRSYSIVIND